VTLQAPLDFFYYSVAIEDLVAWTFNLLVILSVIHGLEWGHKILKHFGILFEDD